MENDKIKCKNILKKDVIDISDDSIYYSSRDNDSFRNIARGSNVTDSNISRNCSAIILIGTTLERQILKEDIEGGIFRNVCIADSCPKFIEKNDFLC